MPIERVTMKHKVTGGTAITTRAALDSLWSKKGWEEVDPAVPIAESVLGHEVKSLDALKREDLDKVATDLGLDPLQTSDKGELVALIEQTLNKE